jgi:hypothetical protein
MELTFPLIFHLSCLDDVFSSGLTVKRQAGGDCEWWQKINVLQGRIVLCTKGQQFSPKIFFFCGASARCWVMASPYGASRSHSDTPHSVGLLWNSDQSDPATSTWQHTPSRTGKHSCSRPDSNPKSQQSSGRRPTPSTARPLGSAKYSCICTKTHGVTSLRNVMFHNNVANDTRSTKCQKCDVIYDCFVI